MILNILISKKIFYEDEVDLFASSSGTALPKSLFPKINMIVSFGSETINKFIKPEFVENRLKQENIINQKFNLWFCSAQHKTLILLELEF